MIALNLRQKMMGCFCLHLFFYVVIGVTLLKEFELFNEDVTLMMHAGNLSNICLEIRRYEKNFIIGHETDDFTKVLEYTDEALSLVPQVIKELKIGSHPVHLQNLTTTLESYRDGFMEFKERCTPNKEGKECSLRSVVRSKGQALVEISDDFVQFEQERMMAFIENFKVQLLKATLFLLLLSIFTIMLLYTSIIKPLKKVEKAALDIANGTFSTVYVDNKTGEVRSVLRAFNTMVSELESRQEQLFQAKKLSSIGTLASGTAHQINNPLNNISTSCQLALSELDAEKNPFVTQMLETINKETARAGEIVRGLLEFSRAQTFSLQPYSLAKLVKKVEQLVAGEIPAGVSLETDIPEDIILFIDVQKVVEALLNLTINALQAIQEPPGDVFIGAEKDPEKKNALITVADTGVGIDEEHLQKIFDPFFTTKNAGNGTGLGLAVVYGIIKKQNGCTKVSSEKGKGTQFTITLPLYQDPSLSNSQTSGITNG
ncbi:MAG: HAMP domain-containing protein [Desulfocapsa sp.]|nr:HAMP domain-containing protein [Desulfocapsa sp.]